MKKFLKRLAPLFLLITLNSPFYSLSGYVNDQNYAEYTLENGMQVFVLEDFSSAPVRIEFSVHAGISAQNASNTGFFPLYTRLFKYGTEEESLLENLKSECNADSSRYLISISPSLVPALFEQLARHAFEPAFTDEAIKKEYSALKTEVMQYAMTPAAFINTSIDSRVYADAPWKQDSGVYPQLFANYTPAQTRAILTRIGKFWYTPQNSAIFVSGSISKETVLALAEKYFGAWQPAPISGRLESVKAGGKAHKFVMYDSQFSDELTQIVIQYTSLDMNQSNLAAATFNSDYSSLKKALCGEHLLNIRGPEYINVSAVHKNGSSRLIYQTLLEQNRKSAVEQAEGFISFISRSGEITRNDEFGAAKYYMNESFSTVTDSSSNFMAFLSDLWSIDSLTPEQDVKHLLLAQKLMDRPEITGALNIEEIKNSLSSEVPFIFVLVNTKTFNKYKQDFKRLGYEEITTKNGSWYTQKLFRNAAAEINNENQEKFDQATTIKNNIDLFDSLNRNSVSSFELSNNIPVTVKTNRVTSSVCILVSIDGGKLSDKNKPGFENVMVNALSSNIQKEIDRYRMQQMIHGFPEILAETSYSQSFITVECAKEDVALCIRSIADALIYSDITPAEADSCVYSVQTQKRLSNASPVNQLYFRAIKYFYDSPFIRNIYDSDKDILQKTSYTDILAAYPGLLDANLYSVVITGNTDVDSVRYVLEESMGILAAQKNQTKAKEQVPEPDFPAKPRKISLKIRHLFYTDVKAEDAGPMPAVLIPTKNFEDPVQFWFKSPSPEEKDYVLFEALLFRLKEKFESSGVDLKIFSPSKEFHCGAISFLSVEHTSFIEELYGKTIVEYSEKFTSESLMELEQTRNAWFLNKLTETETNRGTAKMISLEKDSGQKYYDCYKTLLEATSQDFNRVLSERFLQDPLLKLYSTDAKK